MTTEYIVTIMVVYTTRISAIVILVCTFERLQDYRLVDTKRSTQFICFPFLFKHRILLNHASFDTVVVQCWWFQELLVWQNAEVVAQQPRVALVECDVCVEPNQRINDPMALSHHLLVNARSV